MPPTVTRPAEQARRNLDLATTEAVTPEARALVDAIPAWWHARAGEAGLRGAWRDWTKALPEPPFELAEAAGVSVPVGDFKVGESYVEALDPAVRSAHGRHYTPSALAGHLWALVRRESSGQLNRVYDPAAGAGALLLPALRELLDRTTDPVEAVTAAGERIAGRDLDPVAVWLGNAVLCAQLLPAWAALPAAKRPKMPHMLSVADGLDLPAVRPSAIVMNPPYGRVRLDTEQRERWAEGLHGHANLYGLFLHAAVEALPDGGLLAAVVPTSFLGGAYFKRLRELLDRDAPLRRLTFVGSRAGVYAGDPLQETCLAVFAKAQAACETVALSRITTRPGGVADEEPIGEVVAPPVSDQPWLLARSAEDVALVRHAASMPSRLSTFGWSVSTGPLVWNRHKPQLRPTASDATTPIVWASDITPTGAVEPNPSRDPQRHIVLRDQDEFMRLSSPAVLVQRTTAPEQPRRLVAGVLDKAALRAWGGSVVAENHVNVLRPNGPSVMTPQILAALLDSDAVDRLYRCITGSVAVSAYEIESIPLPDPETVASWHGRNRRQLEAVIEAWYQPQAPAPGS